jgi:hypothetical protein
MMIAWLWHWRRHQFDPPTGTRGEEHTGNRKVTDQSREETVMALRWDKIPAWPRALEIESISRD